MVRQLTVWLRTNDPDRALWNTWVDKSEKFIMIYLSSCASSEVFGEMPTLKSAYQVNRISSYKISNFLIGVRWYYKAYK
jgi:hypothetical protein